jgi:putative exosortase-associated protein (TIGR04073 family)
MKKGALLLLVIFALSLVPAGFAAQENIWQMAQSEEYGKKAGGMLGRGLINAATCFVDLIVQTVEGTQDGPPFVGTLTGLGGGIACTALRATSGVLDVATFWVPGFNGIPVSKSYSNCLELSDEVPDIAEPAAAPAAPSYSAPAPVEKAPKHDPMEYVKK